MIEGRIKHLDAANRSALIVSENGNEIRVNFTLRTNVEIIEDETVGLMGGELEDLQEGYEVELEVAARSLKMEELLGTGLDGLQNELLKYASPGFFT